MSLPEAFARPLQRCPEAPALGFGDDRWTWADLARRVEDARRALRGAGIEVADRLLVPCRPPRETAVALWAGLAEGAHVLPLAPELPARERSRRAEAVGAAFVADVDGIRALSFSPRPRRHAAGEAALLVFTSGSTGPARAVVLPVPALVASADGVVAGVDLRPGDAWLDPLPLSHVGGLAVLFRGARVGAETCLTDGFDASNVAARLESGRVTHASLVARMLHRLLDRPGRPPLRAMGLRCVLVGGGRTEPELLARARAAGLPAVSTYGLSEAGSTVSLHRPGTPGSGLGDAGWPLPGRRLRIGPRGEIQVGGACLMAGYDDGPAIGPWFATGDRGRILADGRLVVLGRRADLIVTGGENVSPAEVEAVIAALPGVEEVCVLGLPHPSWGQELVAWVRWRGEPQPEQVQQAVLSLAPWQRPRRCLSRRGPLPRSALGKLLRDQTRQELQDSGEASPHASATGGPA